MTSIVTMFSIFSLLAEPLPYSELGKSKFDFALRCAISVYRQGAAAFTDDSLERCGNRIRDAGRPSKQK